MERILELLFILLVLPQHIKARPGSGCITACSHYTPELVQLCQECAIDPPLTPILCGFACGNTTYKHINRLSLDLICSKCYSSRIVMRYASNNKYMGKARRPHSMQS